jgi:predicted transglutaminase-like cysteine proteinase
MSRSMAVLAVVILAAVTCGGHSLAQTDKPEDPAKFESDPLMGGEKNVITRFGLTPKWDRIRKLILVGDGLNATGLVEWVKWAQSLQAMAPTERLLAINKRVNRDFKYANDDDIWGQADHWADPAEAVRKKRLDCEDFAIFKFFLAHTAGIEDEDLAIAVGKIRSTGEFHAVMLGADGDTTYVLDNRSSYMRDSATYGDFTIMYSVDFNDVWFYPRAYKNN